MRTLLMVAREVATVVMARATADRYEEEPVTYAGVVRLVSYEDPQSVTFSLADGPVVVQLGGAAVQQQAA